MKAFYLFPSKAMTKYCTPCVAIVLDIEACWPEVQVKYFKFSSL